MQNTSENSSEALDYSDFTKPANVELFSYSHGDFGGANAEDAAVYGARGCFEEDSSLDMFKDENNLIFRLTKKEKKAEGIFEHTAGRGHGSVLDQSNFIFSVNNLTRIDTLFLCQSQFSEFLQQFLRRADASRGYYLSPEIMFSKYRNEAIDLCNKSFSLYEKAKRKGFPAEDARVILPLGTRTTLQGSVNARELMHLHDLSRQTSSPSIVLETVTNMVNVASDKAPRMMKERKNSYQPLAWYPSPNMFGYEVIGLPENKRYQQVELIGAIERKYTKEEMEKIINGISNYRDDSDALYSILPIIKQDKYEFKVKMSLMSLHQAIRQRTWNQTIESIYSSIHRHELMVPPSIRKDAFMTDEYFEISNKMLNLFDNMVLSGVHPQEALSVIPHNLMIFDILIVDGWNAIHSIGKRTCKTAQWEIRSIAKSIARVLRNRQEYLYKFSRPQGVVYGNCPEEKSCGYCEAFLKSNDDQ